MSSCVSGGGTVWYDSAHDTDGDNFANPGTTGSFCCCASGDFCDSTDVHPTDYDMQGPRDCDDSDEDEFPGQDWYLDTDADTFPASITTPTTASTCLRPTSSGSEVYIPSGDLPATADCNDNLALENPDADWFLDNDGDDYPGSITVATTTDTCARPVGVGAQEYFETSELPSTADCLDTDENQYPGQVWYLDNDADEYPASITTSSATQCLEPTGTGTQAYVSADELPSTADCDDADAEELPGQTWFEDGDNDGFPASITVASDTQCERPTPSGTETYVPGSALPASADCDDVDPLEDPESDWFEDADGDGYPASITLADVSDTCERPTGTSPIQYFETSELPSTADCDDSDPDSDPDSIWYLDNDGDGFPASITTASATQCAPPATTGAQAYIEFNNLPATADCNDSNLNKYPGQTWFLDADGDGFPASITVATATQCDEPTNTGTEDHLHSNQLPADPDCDDADSLEDPESDWFIDADGDSFPASITVATTEDTCERPTGTSPIQYFETSELPASADCNDTDAAETPTAEWYLDADGDGFPASITVSDTTACARPTTTSPGVYLSASELPATADCNDSNLNKYPGQTWFLDADGDGFPASITVATATQCDEPTNTGTEDHLHSNQLPLTADCDDADALEDPESDWFIDADGDGFPADIVTATTEDTCERPTGTSPIEYLETSELPASADCNDADPLETPTSEWYLDNDGDGYPDSITVSSTTACSRPTGISPQVYFADTELPATADCDDSDANEFPGQTWFLDADGDGFPADISTATSTACEEPVGTGTEDYLHSTELPATADCDDADALEDPESDWFLDSDGDGFPASITVASFTDICSRPNGTGTEAYFETSELPASADCNDSDPLETPTSDWYLDSDGDGYPASITVGTVTACSRPTGTGTQVYFADTELPATADCDDADANEFPGQTWFLDADGDGFPASITTATSTVCEEPVGTGNGDYLHSSELPATADCDDADPLEDPESDWFLDADGDGFPASITVADFTDTCVRPTGTGTEVYLETSELPSSADCNDSDSDETPSAEWFLDADGDGYPDSITTATSTACARPTGTGTEVYFATSELPGTADCDDADANEFPGQTWFLDSDGDGFPGSITTATSTVCEEPTGTGTEDYLHSTELPATADCDDADALEDPESDWYLDADGDGFPASVSTPSVVDTCERPTGTGTEVYLETSELPSSDDCNDADANETPTAEWFLDADGDGYPDSITTSTLSACSRPSGTGTEAYFASSELPAEADCDDSDADINPDTEWFRDRDQDLYTGETASTHTQCTDPTTSGNNTFTAEHLLLGTTLDCDDNDADLNPDTLWYQDNDQDGFVPSSPGQVTQCDDPSDGTNNYVAEHLMLGSVGSDCDDTDDTLTPDTDWYEDTDGDGYLSSSPTEVLARCDNPDTNGTVAPNYFEIGDPATDAVLGLDCDDGDATINPNTIWYVDLDGDGYLESNAGTVVFCDPVSEDSNYDSVRTYIQDIFAALGEDCDDTNEDLNPNTTWYADDDQDGYSPNSSVSFTQCVDPSNGTQNYIADYLVSGSPGDDCDDVDADLNPTTEWYSDDDDDGYTPSTSPDATQCADPDNGARLYRATHQLTGSLGDDCDDGDADLNPTTIWYADDDTDGYSPNTTASFTQCIDPAGNSNNYQPGHLVLGTPGDDCDDSDPNLNPTTIWYVDNDQDSYVETSTGSIVQCDDPSVNPNFYVAEHNMLGNIGDDCDDGDSTNTPDTVWYEDSDGDGYLADASTITITQPSCANPDTNGTTAPNYFEVGDANTPPLGEDCDDADPTINPDTQWYFDEDGDGYLGATPVSVVECDPTINNTNGTRTFIQDIFAQVGQDCDDTDADLNPNTVWYTDSDGDGYLPTVPQEVAQCLEPTPQSGELYFARSATDPADLGLDCNDSDPTINPDTEWYVDEDGDGYLGATPNVVQECAPISSSGESYIQKVIADANGTVGDDCDDTDVNLNPNTLWFIDADGDGELPTTPATVASCLEPSGSGVTYYRDGTATLGLDCDDTDAELNSQTVWIEDADSDFYLAGSPVQVVQCVRPTGSTSLGQYILPREALAGEDCNDNDAGVHPHAPEVCEDGVQVDQDCNDDFNSHIDINDNEVPVTATDPFARPFLRDADNDTYGADSGDIYLCKKEDNFAERQRGIDCDDTDPDIHPNAPEVCNGVDEDCDFVIDEAEDLAEAEVSGCLDFFQDRDNDNHGDPAEQMCLCWDIDDQQTDESGTYFEVINEAGETFVSRQTDCHDFDPDIYQGWGIEYDIYGVITSKQEKLDGHDNDCDGTLALIELDCDDDGSLAVLPLDPNDDLLTQATEAGLEACGELDEDLFNDLDGRTFSCWGEATLRLECNFITGLWEVRNAVENGGELFAGGHRETGESPCMDANGTIGHSDCDDFCADRCSGLEEVCDGLDNDCADLSIFPEFFEQVDGVPLAADPRIGAFKPGLVNVAELDPDSDGVFACDDGTAVAEQQEYITIRTCDDKIVSDDFENVDCNPMCSLMDFEKSPACSDMVGDCGSAMPDEDLDGFLECGPGGSPDLPEEKIYTLVYFADVTQVDEAPSGPQPLPNHSGDTHDTSTADDTAGTDDSDEPEPEDTGEERAVGLLDYGYYAPLLTPRISPATERMATCDRVLYEELRFLVNDLSGAVNVDHDPQSWDNFINGTSDDDPLLQLCLDAKEGRIEGMCAVVELTLNVDADEDLHSLETPDWPDSDRFPQYDDLIQERRDCWTGHPEELISRTVWSAERIVEARERVVEWECLKAFGVPCQEAGDLNLEIDPADLYLEPSERARITTNMELRFRSRDLWWLEMGRFNPVPVVGGSLMECWGDPTSGGIRERVGGDCMTQRGIPANRNLTEGPDDLLAVYLGGPFDCDRCLDGIDNNCDGTIDCGDDSCAPCFVGLGVGCGSGGEDRCAQGGCSTQEGVRGRTQWPLGLMLVSYLTLIGLTARRRR